MKKSLVLAEKPSVARDIANAMNCTKELKGYFENDKYIVTWALGHLVTLADPESYDTKYKQWNMEDLPMMPERLKLTVIKQSSKQYYTVKQLLERSDIGQIIIATDAGREGELVARWILEKAKVKKPIKRLWISSVTNEAIRKGFANLQEGQKYENLYKAAQARAEADWYIGLNATRALTVRHNAQLNSGRVQTPTLALIAKREEQIKNFQPKSYYGIEATLDSGVKFIWQSKNGEQRTFNKEENEAIISKISRNKLEIVNVESKNKRQQAPALYDLTELQRDANKLFGYSAKETLNIMQSLYERHKILTYPRTDSRFLTTDIVETIPERLKTIPFKELKPFVATILKEKIQVNKSFVDNQKVSDHHAIIPTEHVVLLNNLNDKEYKIYELVVKRFIANLLPAYEYEEMKVLGKMCNEQFICKLEQTKQLGFKQLFNQEKVDNKQSFTIGDQLNVKLIYQTSGLTKAPARFTEATLLSAMENPSTVMSEINKEAKEMLKATGGLGTVATRADIIDKLFSSFLVEKKGQELHITSKGKQLLELVPELLKSPETTAQWELRLEQIAKGNESKEAFITEMKTYTKQLVQEIKSSSQKFKHDNMTGKPCPECGKYMLEVNGKKGKMLVCQDRECGHKKNVSRVTNARCPQCKKKLELRGEKENQTFACVCGYREKLSIFEARKKKESNTKVSKHSVQKYLKQQEKETEPMNNPFANLLKDLDL